MEQILTIIFFTICEISCITFAIIMKKNYYVVLAICKSSQKIIDASLDGSVSYEAVYEYYDFDGKQHKEKALSFFKPKCGKECRILVNKYKSHKIKPYNHLVLGFITLFFFIVIEIGIALI